MKSEGTHSEPRRVPTKIFARRNHVEPATCIKRVCKTGSYHGIIPTKLANGRWDWPDVTVVKALRTGGVEQ